MEKSSRDLFVALDKRIPVTLIKWGGSNAYLPLVLPYFFVVACWQLLIRSIDVVHGNDGLLAPLCYLLATIARKPFTIVIHGLDITYTNKAYQMIVPWFIRRADIVFCVSRATADAAVDRGVDEKRIQVISNGATDDSEGPRDVARRNIVNAIPGIHVDTPLLLTVGRLVERKGVAWFIANVMPMLVKTYPTIMYVVAGSGEDEDTIKAVIKKQRLQESVLLLGRVTDKMRADLYNSADVFIQANLPVSGNMEGFGLILLEASLCRLPVVAAGIEGVKDAIVNGRNGILVASKDSVAFVDEISRFIDDKEMARQFGVSSRNYTLKHFQWDTIAKKYVESYASLLRG